MPLGPVENLVFSAIDLLKGSLIIAIPVFVFAVAGKLLREKIAKATKWPWIISALAATFSIMWLVLMAAYFVPFLDALGSSGVGETPSAFAPPQSAIFLSYIAGLLKVVLAAAVASLLLMPLELVGAFAYDWLSKKYKKTNQYIRVFAAVFVASLVAAALLLFIVPEALQGFIFYFYFG